MDTSEAEVAAGRDQSQLGHAADTDPAEPTALTDPRESEDLRRVASLALATAIRRYRQSFDPAVAPRTGATLDGGLARFLGHRPDEWAAAQTPSGGESLE
ncbi:hypothetical protein [Sinomonas humi]|uniref:Uncharacterized protein n=1 Tax=Sinomonas humi TaxID=1338436 RepID=A0A0B2AHK5_9MICC|nr:hypothetical protein [Sinomonas humi]KHL01304.1 hypothetical protein LK10_16845 [Sinomonas humi]